MNVKRILAALAAAAFAVAAVPVRAAEGVKLDDIEAGLGGGVN